MIPYGIIINCIMVLNDTITALLYEQQVMIMKYGGEKYEKENCKYNA